MKKKIIIFIIAMTLSVFAGCQNSETGEKETIQDNEVSQEDEMKNDENQDLDNEIIENDNSDDEEKDNEGNNDSDKEITDKENSEVSNNKDNNNNSNTVIKDNVNNNTENNDNLNNESSTDNNENEVEGNGDVEGEDVLKGELSAIIEKIYGVKDTGLKVGNNVVDLSNMDSVQYYTGLNDVSKVKEALASETLIGSQAYSLVLVRAIDAASAESVANDMLSGINPRKWVCVEADDLQVVTYDDLVMLIMVSSSHEDTVTSQQIVDAFKEICGDELDVVLKK